MLVSFTSENCCRVRINLSVQIPVCST